MTSGLYQIQRNLIAVYLGGLIVNISVQTYSAFRNIPSPSASSGFGIRNEPENALAESTK